MATLLQQVKNLEKLSQKAVTEEIFQALKKAEKEIISLNQGQLSKGQDSEGDIVGEYADITQSYADADRINNNKSAGDPYNFNWFGDFFDGFELSVSGVDATISSVGVGSGGKKDFLTTNDLFGLTDENLKFIIKTEILPFIHKFARNTLNL
tara:strand:+ start:1894 stop:2349 length:456 start_codon:yes stop_codon:yes gene_type:complete